MEPTQLLAMMNQMDPGLLGRGGAAARVCHLELRRESLRDQEELKRVLLTYAEQFGNMRGWFCRQSDVVHFSKGRPPLDMNIQYGEIAGDPSNGLLIRPDGVGGFRLIHQMERPGDTHLAVAHRHIGRRRMPHGGAPAGDLLYWVYWTRGDGDYHNTTARLVDFATTEVTS